MTRYRIDWYKVQGRAAALVAALAAIAFLWTLVHFCGGCAASVRSVGPSTKISHTTQTPCGQLDTWTGELQGASGSATGDKAATLKTDTALGGLKIPGGGEAGPTDSEFAAVAKMGGLSLFVWAAIVCGLGAAALLAFKQVRLGLWAALLAVVFALCAWSPFFLLGVAAVAVVSLYHTGRSFEGLRAVVATAKTQGVWATIQSNLHSVADFGDHAAVKAAEKAET